MSLDTLGSPEHSSCLVHWVFGEFTLDLVVDRNSMRSWVLGGPFFQDIN